MRFTWLSFALILAGCPDPEPVVDAGTDAGESPPDAGTDAGTDAGPPPTGCDLWTGDAGAPSGDPLPAPDAFDPPSGPGAPATTFEAAQLGVGCAYLPMGEADENHHNTGFFLDGYLVRPWAHERGRGGIAVWDFHDPCAPVLVANPLDEQIRETHSTGYSTIGGRWISVASLTGIELWDVSDVTAPVMVTDFALPEVRYPDAYMRTVMSTSWQAPYIYVGASDNGIYVVDAADPTAPELVGQYLPEPLFRVGQVIAVGNQLHVFSSEGSVAAIFDIRDPAHPRPIPGGTYSITNGTMDRLGRPIPLPAYFGMVNGGYMYHPRIGFSGGLAIFDVHDPSAPTFVGDFEAPGGDGGYVFIKEGVAFVGFSAYGATLDLADPTAPAMIHRYDHTGDVDTLTPFGNVVVVSVDDDAIDGQASVVVPFATEVDANGPAVNMVVPADGATDQPLTTRVGLTFTEFVSMNSVFRGSVILRGPDGVPLDAHLSGQEGIVHLWPERILAPSTTYTVEVPAGGITDLNGNPTTAAFTSSFTTVSCE
ncbi:MAG: Ig-like domain-containing protein [Myxococcales bacterium]|nr:Ig-like domain-containing protein [Myxococcales bacterium]